MTTLAEDRREEFKKNIAELKLDKKQAGGDAATPHRGPGAHGRRCGRRLRRLHLFADALGPAGSGVVPDPHRGFPRPDSGRCRTLPGRIGGKGAAAVVGSPTARGSGPDRSDLSGAEHTQTDLCEEPTDARHESRGGHLSLLGYSCVSATAVSRLRGRWPGIASDGMVLRDLHHHDRCPVRVGDPTSRVDPTVP